MTTRPTYTGHLRKVDGAIVGEIRDIFGWVITLTATPDPAGGYVLNGVLGETPPAMWVPYLDDEAAS